MASYRKSHEVFRPKVPQGFDNIIAIKNIDESDLEYLETFAKSEHYKKTIPPDSDFKKFLWIFHEDHTSFEILRGHRKMLLEIVQRLSKEYENGTFPSLVKNGQTQFPKLKSGLKGNDFFLISIKRNS